MRPVVEARKRLKALVEKTQQYPMQAIDMAVEIEEDILPLLFQPPRKRKTPKKNRTMTKELAAEVRAYAKMPSHAFRSLQEIGDEFGINPGNVSAVLNGKYGGF